MNDLERRKRLDQLIDSSKKKVDKLHNEITALCRTKKSAKENAEQIEYLKEDLKEWQIVLDTYEFLEYELDLY